MTQIHPQTLKIESFEVGPFPNNLYLVLDESTQEFVIIDPSISSEEALGRARELTAAGYTLRAIWNTHGHVDHIHDNVTWKRAFDVPVIMHEADDFLLEHLREQSIWLGLPPTEPVPVDARFQDNEEHLVGNHEVQTLHVPGHSPGSIAFYFKSAGLVISGDVLFRGSIGRYDLPGSDYNQLQNSLRRLAALPPETQVLPGHGAATTIGEELQTNPYLQKLSTEP